jgi:hypothetical protein
MNYNKLIIKNGRKTGREWRMNVPGEGVAAGAEEADGDGGGEGRGKAVVLGQVRRRGFK